MSNEAKTAPCEKYCKCPLCVEQMIKDNMGLVHYWARRSWSQADYDDLVQEGTLGLLRAIQKFRPDYGFKFSTYAAFWIKQRLRRTKLAGLQALSLDAPIPGTDGATLGDTIEAPDDGEMAAWQAKLNASQLLAPLDDSLGTIASLYYVDGLTLQEIGDMRGVTRERIRQLLEEALQLLRARYETGDEP